MERTTNRQKKGTNAFTLAEFLVVIAIITILAGVSFVAAIKYQRRLRRMEMDRTAKEIFLAAQNQLSLETATGSIERLLKENTDDSDKKLGTAMDGGLYYILYQADAESSDDADIRERLLPFGSIDETVRTDGNYVIIYEPESGMVRTVWYSDQFVFSADDLSSEELAQAALSADKREQFGPEKQPIGYYAGDTIQNPSVVNPPEKLEKPKLTLINEDVLYAKVEDTNSGNASLRVWIEGVSSHAKGYIALTGTGSSRLIREDDGWRVILDDISIQNGRFAQLNRELKRSDGGNSESFIPGEDILVYAEAFTQTSSAKSDSYRSNSLFGNVNADKIVISSIRHLENLDKRISVFDPEGQAAAIGLSPIEENPKTYAVVQQKDLFWNKEDGGYCSNVNAIHGTDTENPIAIYYDNGSKTAQSQNGCFASIHPAFALSYNGNGHSIENVTIKPLQKALGDNAQKQDYATGLFGEVTKNLTVKNLKLVRFDVTSRSSAGALIGQAKGTGLNVAVQDVLSEYAIVVAEGKKPLTDLEKQVDAGAVIGGFDGEELFMTKTMAANIRPDSYVAETNQEEQAAPQDENSQDPSDDSACKIQSKYGDAGGLIGSVKGNLILTGCAASVYVDAKSYAGGLVARVVKGTDSQTVRIENSYVGAHTVNGEFLLTEPPSGSGSENVEFKTDAGRYNIVSRNQYAGGLAAVIPETSKISHAYVTASVYAKGKSADDDPKKLAFVAEYQTAKSIYAGCEADKSAYCYSVCVVNGETVSSDLGELETLKGKKAFHYDTTLPDTYPMPTILQLLLTDPETKDSVSGDKGQSLVTDKVYPKFASVHVGDWIEPEKQEPTENGMTINNGNRLWVDYVMDMPQGTEETYLTFAVTGEVSRIVKEGDKEIEKPVYYVVKSDMSGSQYYFTNSGDFSSISYRSIDPKVNNENGKRIERIVTEDGKLKIRLYIDDLSYPASSYRNIYDNGISGGFSNELAAGEYVRIRCYEEVRPYNGEDKYERINSMFEDVTEEGGIYTAYITNARHLENLNAYDSRVPITRAVQDKDILWQEDPDYQGDDAKPPYCKEMLDAYGKAMIYSGKDVRAEEGSFLPIVNDKITFYEGKNHIISKLHIDGTTWGNTSGAVFQSVGNEMTMQNLRLKDPYIVGKGSAAGLIGTAGDGSIPSGSSLTLTNVTIYGDEMHIKAKAGGYGCLGGAVASAQVESVKLDHVRVYGRNALLDSDKNVSGVSAGGLIGSMKVKKDVSIDQCLFSAYLDGEIYGNGVGGLIGKLEAVDGPDYGKAEITNCYVAGRNDTYFQSSDTDLLKDGVSLIGGWQVGGLIGCANGSLSISNTFSTAGLYNKNGIWGVTGGLIGQYDGNAKLSLTQCYYVGNMSKLENATGSWGDKTGVLIGVANGTAVKFNDCAYLKKSGNIIGSAGMWSNEQVTNTGLWPEATDEGYDSLKTYSYNAALQGQKYPYKIWTMEGDAKTYRGDWITQ